MLDELGVTDQDGDGKREMPDGSKLIIRLDFPADTRSDHIAKNELLAKHWNEIGIDAKLSPIPPAGFPDRWAVGEIMTNTAWETGDGPNCLVYPQCWSPSSRRAGPLFRGSTTVSGAPRKEDSEKNKDPYKRTPPRMEPEPGGPVEQLWKLYDKSKVEPDDMKRHRLVWEMCKVHVEDGPFFMGCVANQPTIVLVREGMNNVPAQENLTLGGFTVPAIHPTPAVYDPESWYWENPEEHS